jgi:hypothetical protein
MNPDGVVMKFRCLSLITGLLAVTAVAGCAVPDAQRRRQLDLLVGHAPVDVVRQLGVPSRSFTAGDRTFLAYVDETSSYFPGPSYGGRFGYGRGWAWDGWSWDGGGWGGGYDRSACETIFEIVQGHVAAWSLHGGGC